MNPDYIRKIYSARTSLLLSVLIIFAIPLLVFAESKVTLKKLHVDETTEGGADEVYYEVYADDKKVYTSSEQAMNEDSGDKLENWRINKSYTFQNKLLVKVKEKDRRKDDLIGEYYVVAGEDDHKKTLTFNKGSKYKLDVVYNNGKQSSGDSFLFTKKTAFVEKYGAYSCNSGKDPWVERGGPNPETNSACSIPKSHLLKVDKEKLKVEFDVNIDGFVPDKNYEKFHPACQFHDVCYASPWEIKGENGQKVCDERFLDRMKLICNEKHNDGSPNWIKCRTAARVFYAFVKIKGKSSYDGGQQWAKNHCPNP